MKLQYLLGTNSIGARVWQDCGERTDEFLDRAAAFAKSDRTAVLDKLARGTVYFAPAHDAMLRDAGRVQAQRSASPAQPEPVKCVICGEHQPASRFTTLPISARTCDDCV